MADGREHFKMAERLIELVDDTATSEDPGAVERTIALREALVHAILANAAGLGVDGEEPEAPPRTVTFDLTDTDASFALIQALEDFSARQRAEAEQEGGHQSRTRWADRADEMRAQAEAAG
jgi:hypothetical protein